MKTNKIFNFKKYAKEQFKNYFWIKNLLKNQPNP